MTRAGAPTSVAQAALRILEMIEDDVRAQSGSRLAAPSWELRSADASRAAA